MFGGDTVGSGRLHVPPDRVTGIQRSVPAQFAYHAAKGQMQDPAILRSLFLAELRTEAQQNRWDAAERVQWILFHLHEYIERWLGFAALAIHPGSLVQSDLFTVIDIAVEELESHVSEIAGAGNQFIGAVRESLDLLREHGSTGAALNLKAALEQPGLKPARS